VGPTREDLGRARGNAGPYPPGTIERLMVQLALHTHQPVEALARMEPRLLATFVEELSDNGTS
jgi:hypothetical protein